MKFLFLFSLFIFSKLYAQKIFKVKSKDTVFFYFKNSTEKIHHYNYTYICFDSLRNYNGINLNNENYTIVKYSVILSNIGTFNTDSSKFTNQQLLLFKGCKPGSAIVFHNFEVKNKNGTVIKLPPKIYLIHPDGCE